MESDRVIFDSSVVIAYYIDDDVHHVEAMRVAEALHDKFIVLHPFVIQEVATVLTYRFTASMTALFFADIRSAQNVAIPTVQIEKDIEFFERTGKKMSFTDLALIRLSREMSAPLFTFDKQILSFLRNRR